MTSFEEIINESQGIKCYLPNVDQLKEAVKKAQEWISKVDGIQVNMQLT